MLTRGTVTPLQGSNAINSVSWITNKVFLSIYPPKKGPLLSIFGGGVSTHTL